MVSEELHDSVEAGLSYLKSRSIWANSPTDNAPYMNEYFQNSLERESPEMDRIRDAVREAGVFIVLGYSERYKGTLYIAQVC